MLSVKRRMCVLQCDTVYVHAVPYVTLDRLYDALLFPYLKNITATVLLCWWGWLSWKRASSSRCAMAAEVGCSIRFPMVQHARLATSRSPVERRAYVPGRCHAPSRHLRDAVKTLKIGLLVTSASVLSERLD